MHLGRRSAHAFDELVETRLRLVQTGIGDEGDLARLQGREFRVVVGEMEQVKCLKMAEPIGLQGGLHGIHWAILSFGSSQLHPKKSKSPFQFFKFCLMTICDREFFFAAIFLNPGL